MLRAGLLSLTLIVARAAWATTTPTVYDNAQNYPLGSRAAAMGGAYTALACDEAAVHYNPAALACAAASRVELAANAYVLQGLSIPDALGVGLDVAAVNYHSLPAIVGGARLIDAGDPQTRVGRWVWGLSVTIPHSLALRVEPSAPTRPSGLVFAGRDMVIAGDLGMGYQLTPTLALGASVGGGVRSFEAHVSELLASDTADCADGACTQYVMLAEEQQSTAVGLRAKLALRYTPTPDLSIGLTLTSPAVHVWGTTSESSATTFAVRGDDDRLYYAGVVSRVEGTSELALPGRVHAGVAWSRPGLTLSLDASVHLPRTVALARDRVALPVEGQPPPEVPADVVLERRLHPNFAAGAELEVADGVVLDAGVYTDLSAVSDADFEAGLADRVHLFGATFALGLLGRETRSWFGVAGAIGRGEARVPSSERTLAAALSGELAEERVVPLTRWTVAAFLGSSYSFYGDD